MSEPTILVVDDSPDALLSTRRALRSSNYELVMATTVAEAEAAWAERPPDLVLLDVNLPDGNGIEVCHRWKATDERRSVPVILRSSVSVSAGEQALGLVSGADGYLIEPVEAEVLQATVAAHLRISYLLDELEEATEHATDLVDFSIEMARAASVDEVLKRLDAGAEVALGASEIRLQWRRTGAATEERHSYPADTSSEFVDHLIDRLGQRPAFHRDLSTLTDVPVPPPTDTGSWAVIPFDVVSIEGVLAIACVDPQKFAAPQRQMFRTFVSITALSLARVAALDLYRTIAETLQDALVPDLQVARGIRLRRRLLVAEGATTAGGDWYDGYSLPSGRQALLVGDVVGHGARAAGQSAVFRHSLRTLLLTGAEPGRAMVQLEELVVSHPDRPRGTLLLTVIDSPARTATLYSVAHPPPILIGADGEARTVAVAPVPPLGSGLLTVEPVPLTVELAPGAVLVLITDGVIERRGKNLDRSYEELCEALRGAATVKQAMEAIASSIGQRLLDDDALFAAISIDSP